MEGAWRRGGPSQENPKIAVKGRMDAEGAQTTGVHGRGVAAAWFCRRGLLCGTRGCSGVREWVLQ